MFCFWSGTLFDHIQVVLFVCFNVSYLRDRLFRYKGLIKMRTLELQIQQLLELGEYMLVDRGYPATFGRDLAFCELQDSNVT